MAFWSEDTLPMLEVFQSETTELLGELSAQLLEAEKRGIFSGDGINRVFRIIHTVKSASAVMGLDAMSSCTHQLEDLFQVFRTSPERLAGQLDAVFALLYAYQDYIQQELACTGDADFRPSSAGELPNQIATLLAAVKKQEAVSLRVRLKKDCQMEGVRGEMLLRRVRPLCHTLRWEPQDLDDPAAEHDIRKNGLRLFFTANDPQLVREKLSSFRYAAAVEDLEDDPPAKSAVPILETAGHMGTPLANPPAQKLAVPAEKTAAAEVPPASGQEAVGSEEAPSVPETADAEVSPAPAQGERDSACAEKKISRATAENQESRQSCTVSWQDVATLQNLLGELITVDGMLAALAAQSPELVELDAVSRRYHNLLDHLDETAQRMAMTTLSAVSQQLYRTVREICRREGKLIRMEITGEDTLADRAILDRITPSLIHLVRNAADHGIEPPEVRRLQGKPEQGVVSLAISADSGLLTLRLRDDGRGLSSDRILAAAKRLGLLEKAAEDYTLEEIHALLLQPGFSTADSATDISGRGVGLDVVRSATDALGGALRIESIPGQYTAFSMQVPVSSTSLDALGFQVGQMVCLLPMRNVQRVDSVVAAVDALYAVDGTLLYGREAPIPVLRLSEQKESEDECLVTVQSLNQSMALIVGSSLGRMTVVERPLPPPFDASYRKKTGVQGCCLLGDGRIGLTVSIERLFALHREEEAQ